MWIARGREDLIFVRVGEDQPGAQGFLNVQSLRRLGFNEGYFQDISTYISGKTA